MKKGELTTRNYWDATYQARKSVEPIEIAGWRNLCARRILTLKTRIGLEGKSILELGGGGSAWLAFLAAEYPHTRFACLDFSEDGVQSLHEFKRKEGLENLTIYFGDFFNPPSGIGQFDFVYSHGVVEHFQDLAGVLSAHAKFLSGSGTMLTIIPNMAGLNGLLTKWLNNDVYDIHVPHDLSSFRTGHEQAGLRIVDSGYLCSNNFGVLSSCVREKAGWKRFSYRQLSRFSKIVWLFENTVHELPATRVFSPYIYAVSEKSN
ncbi:MAG: class I SAM-dependent methyltransferase [Gammaproteobacteria bacterium]